MGKQENTLKHSEYYQCDAGETYRRHMLKLRIVNVVFLILVWFAAILAVLALEKETNGEICYILAMLFIVLIWFARRVYGVWRIKKLNEVLVLDCDAVKMYEIITLMQRNDKKGRAHNTLALMKARCCLYIEGKWDEGLNTLNHVCFAKKVFGRELARLRLYADFFAVKGDWQNLSTVKSDIMNLSNELKQKKMDRDSYNKTLQYIRFYELLRDGREEEAGTLAGELMKLEATNVLQRKVLKSYMGELKHVSYFDC